MSNRSRATRTLDGRALLPLLVCTTAACGGAGDFDRWCNTQGTETSLLVFALFAGLIALVIVWWGQKRRLEAWDLRESSDAPAAGWLAWIFPAVFLVAALALSVALWGADCAREQIAMNLWFTWLGVLAIVLCVLGGVVGANWLYTRR